MDEQQKKQLADIVMRLDSIIAESCKDVAALEGSTMPGNKVEYDDAMSEMNEIVNLMQDRLTNFAAKDIQKNSPQAGAVLSIINILTQGKYKTPFAYVVHALVLFAAVVFFWMHNDYADSVLCFVIAYNFFISQGVHDEIEKIKKDLQERF